MVTGWGGPTQSSYTMPTSSAVPMSQKPTAYKVREDELASREEQQASPRKAKPATQKKPAASAKAKPATTAAPPATAAPGGAGGGVVSGSGSSGGMGGEDAGMGGGPLEGLLASLGGDAGGAPQVPFQPMLGPGLRAGLGQRAYPQRNAALAGLGKLY